MTDVVVDASAGVEIALRTQTGRQLSGNLAGRSVYVPESFYTESAGVLRRMLARGEITAERAQQALTDLLTLETHRVSIKPPISEAWQLRHSGLHRASTPAAGEPSQRADAEHRAQTDIAARLADGDFGLPGTLTERHIRCGKPDCRCTAPASRPHLTLRIAERAEGWTEKSR